MSNSFWAGVGILTAVATLFAYQRRLLTRGRLLLECQGCGDMYTCYPEGLQAAMQLHVDYKCSHSGYDAWEDAA